MAKLAAQLKDKFFGLVGCITSCGRAGHKDAVGAKEPNSSTTQHTEIRSRGPPPKASGGSTPGNN